MDLEPVVTDAPDSTPVLSRRTALAALALGLTTLPAETPAQAPAPKATPARDLTGELEALRGRYRLPSVAGAVVQRGELIAAGASGVRALGRTVPVTLDDRYHLGSDTKAMTALLAGMAVESGKLAWDSRIGDVLGRQVPDLNPALAQVTLEQLLSHAGGIPSDTDELLQLYFNTDAFQYNLAPLRLRVIDAWKHHAPATPPGKEFHYANLGYLIGGAMIETALGDPWESLITGRIFAPLGLTSAGLGAQASTGRLDAPVGHQVDDHGAATPMLWGAAADIPPVLGPAGTAHMSIRDFATWAGWNAGLARRAPHLVKPQTLARIHRPHIDTGRIEHPRPGVPSEGQYGMGWGIVKFAWSATPLLTHNGSNSMNLAKVLVDTAQDVAVVLATNYPGERADDALNEGMTALYRPYAAA
ncbi:MAG: beta-lactamase family protein [Proteobacteria bacterium]|nr:beta-lactamase family protein [Pseudomonadota bacterium]